MSLAGQSNRHEAKSVSLQVYSTQNSCCMVGFEEEFSLSVLLIIYVEGWFMGENSFQALTFEVII